MKSLKQFISENAKSFNNWKKPDRKALEHEYKIEYEIKPLKGMTGDAFPTFNDFFAAAKKAKVISVTDSINSKIAYRSNTRSKEQIISLIKGYASYPQYRNEKTIDAIYQGFEDGESMSMPIVLELADGSMRIMGGNTRMDIARQLGITPKALLIKVPAKKE